ncbi:MAG: hypothetical protein J0L78_15190 [Planctomycetes bacterium]|nr:hypothetical protein [Planctomycetota bacterium]
MQQSHHAFTFRSMLALVIFAVGVSWACFVIVRGGGNSLAIALPPKSGEKTLVVAIPPPAVVDASQEKQLADRTTESVRAAVARVPVSPPNPADAAAIARETSDTLNLAIYPTAAKYLDYLRERGEADGPFSKFSESERDAFVRSKGDSFAGQSPDLSKVETRWRYINGREITVPDERGGYETPRRCVDAIEKPSASGLTVLEILVPVPAKTLLKGTQPCRLGIWIGKTREKPTWTTMRIYTYDTPPTAGVMTPPF